MREAALAGRLATGEPRMAFSLDDDGPRADHVE
jgi:hypothetical protein